MFWGQKVKVQDHGGVQHAGKCTFWPCYCIILQITGLNFTKLSALMNFATEMNASMFGVKRLKVKVTA